MNEGQNEDGPVSGAGARVPTATTVIFRLPSAVVIASHNLRPAVGLHAPGSSAITIRTFAPSPNARLESLEITLTLVLLARCSTPSILQR